VTDSHHDTAGVPAHAPLTGVRVLDLSSVVMGPFATQLLADLGADVITVERAVGDTNRVMGAGPHPQLSGVALNLQRNKRNISVDIRHPEGRSLVLRLLATCDAVVTNLRPGVLARAGLTYDDARDVRADIVFCQAHGFASDSPQADEPAYDDIVQAASGLADAFRRATGTPALAPTILADKVCALTIAYAVTAALLRRQVTGLGQHIEVPMVDTMRSFMLVEHGSGAIPVGGGPAGYPRILTPQRRPQQTADGWINVLPYSAAHYDSLFAVHRPDLVGDSRYATGRLRIQNSDFLYEQVRGVLVTRTTDEWLAFCRAEGIPCSPVVSLDDLVEELPVVDHPVAGPYRHIPSPVRFDRTNPPLRRTAPLIGQHTAEILAEVGVSGDELRHLAEVGAITPLNEGNPPASDAPPEA
jgi:crotonobetainyl-CoA:carnitine CoA-transferase CaiB-like acyl-CoA transferase